MPRFAVTRARGPAWDPGRSMRQQDGWDAHAAFMDGLVAEGFIVLGGPLGNGERTLLIIDAASEADVEAKLAKDPWTPLRLLRVASVERWEILLSDGA